MRREYTSMGKRAVNTAKGTLSRGEKELVLTKNEMIIFLSLLNNIGKIVSRDELMTGTVG